MDIESFVKLTGRAWAPTLLALMARGVPGRQAVLLARAGAPRSAFAGSMARLIEMRLVQRNPGHGHPLRPEYVLTDAGRVAGAAMMGALSPGLQAGTLNLMRRTWSLPVLGALRQPSHFGQIATRLSPVTDRALSQSLKALENAELVTRIVRSELRPPRAIYARSALGAEVALPLDRQIVWS